MNKFTNDNCLNPYYILGLIQANGRFTVAKQKRGLSIWLSPAFKLTLNKKNESLLNEIKKYFKVGKIIEDRGSLVYEVTKLKDLINVIIPFLLEYQLFNNKFKTFIKFKIICEKLFKKEHLNKTNNVIYYLLNLAYHLNSIEKIKLVNQLKLIENIKDDYLREIVLSKDIYYNDLIQEEMIRHSNFKLNIDFIKGLFDLKGKIFLSLDRNMDVAVILQLHQLTINKELLDLIKDFFNGIGKVKSIVSIRNKTFQSVYEVDSMWDIYDNILSKYNDVINDSENSIQVYKLRIIKELLEYLKKNHLTNVKLEDRFNKYIEYHYKIDELYANMTFDEYKVIITNKYKHSIINNSDNS